MPPTRIERATRGLGNRCSIQLSYGGIFLEKHNPEKFVVHFYKTPSSVPQSTSPDNQISCLIWGFIGDAHSMFSTLTLTLSQKLGRGNYRTVAQNRVKGKIDPFLKV